MDDDRYWKAGGVYFNPDDPTILVPKRFGIGWTFNFAHPIAWVILALRVFQFILLSSRWFLIALQAGVAQSSSDIAQLSTCSSIVDGELTPDHAYHRA